MSTAATETLALPSPTDQAGENGEGKTQTLMVGGEAIKLDHLGPVVLNTDGSMSQINNWSQMTEQEQQTTLRMIGKRNQKRREQLLAAEQGAK
jgi:hypothetical protein